MEADPFSIHRTGPLLVGALLSFFLSGVFAMQVYHYSMNYAPTDRTLWVYLVSGVVVIELLHMSFSTHVIYNAFAASFGSPTAFTDSPFSAAALPALNGSVGFCTQMFFAWRIHALAKSTIGRATACLVALTAGMQVAAAFGVTVQWSLADRHYEFLLSLDTTVTVWLAGSVACDVLITLTMVVLLLSARSNIMQASKGVLNILIANTIENGMVTTLCALADLVCFLLIPNYYYHVCLDYLLGRLYANVLLASLNARQRTRSRLAASNSNIFNATSRSAACTSADLANEIHFKTYQTNTTQDHSTKSRPVDSTTKTIQIDDLDQDVASMDRNKSVA